MRHNIVVYLTPVIFGFLLINCDPSGKKPSEMTTKELLKSREIRKISDIDILESSKELGNKIVALAQKNLANKLQQALDSGGLAHAIQFCNINAMPVLDSIKMAYNAEIKRVSSKRRNPNNNPNDLENQILEAYAYNIAQKLSISESVQMMEDGKNVLYTKPILLTNPMCLKCHGSVENQITKANYKLIQNIYPNDSAIEYNIKDLRGMWSVTLYKKEIIQALD